MLSGRTGFSSSFAASEVVSCDEIARETAGSSRSTQSSPGRVGSERERVRPSTAPESSTIVATRSAG
ncbi:Uncharacterised protein [Mycobacteroides abscessus subsp. abscessus]|nr:Uncharacterised protein [Mycobacteroides abscessus subsp. abscessus]